jgi:Beta-lactamase class C and other penicillin binding proteins
MRTLQLALLGFGTWAAAALPVAGQGFPADLDQFIEDGMTDWNVPGLAISVVKDGQVIYQKGFGVREAGQTDPVDENTVFAIGSTSKAFTSAAIATLVDSGKVNWDTRVVDVWPSFRMADPWVTGEIRVSDLLANHSGLSVLSEALWYGTDLTREQIVERLSAVPIEEGFRYRFQYRNVMFLAAGQLIPRVDGRTWDDYIRQTFFIPLGMTRTFPTDSAIPGLSNVARPHVIDYEGKPRPVPYRNMDNIAPAGSIISCVKDMSNWVKLQLARGAFDGMQIIQSASVDFMHRPQTPLSDVGPAGQPLSPPTELSAYCLAWVTQSYKGTRIVWHNGGIDGMSTWVGLVPSLDLGVVITSNLDECDLRKAIFFKIIDSYVGNPPSGLEAELVAQNNARLAARDLENQIYEDLLAHPVTPPLPLEKYAGTYRNPVLGEATITVENNRLVYRRTPFLTIDLLCQGGNNFLGKFRSVPEDLRDGKQPVRFEVKNGVVTGFLDAGVAHYQSAAVPSVTPHVGSIGRRVARGRSFKLTGTTVGGALRVEYRVIGQRGIRQARGVSQWTIPLRRLSLGKNRVIVRVIGPNGNVASTSRVAVRRVR